MRIRRMSVFHAVIGLVLVLALVLPWVALADDVSNTIDATVDSTLETMNLTQGGANGSTNLLVSTTNGDGKNGCNLTGSTTLTVSVNTNDSTVATVSPASVTFSSCGDTPTLTVTPHNPGSANITLTQTSNSSSGTFNLAPASFTVNVAAAPPSDTTGPTVTCTPPDQTIWYGANQTVNCTASDSDSGLADPLDASFILSTSVPANTETSSAATDSRMVSDSAGNSTTAGPYTFKVDLKAPDVMCAAPDGIWHATDATIACTATDGGSDLAQPSDASFSLTTNVANGDETANAPTNSHDVADAVGNTTTAGPINGNMVDKKGPAITINAPTNTAYLLGQGVAADYGCTDGGSGVATCAGPVSSGSNIDTASVGSKSFAVNAADNVGNTNSNSVVYSVVYASSGTCVDGPGHQILQPINVDGSSVFKQGSTIPAKFRVCDANGNSIGSAGVVSSFKLISKTSGTSTDTVNEDVISTSSADTAFRWDSSAQQWIFNINTKSLVKNCTYTYKVTLNDGSNILFSFGLK